MSRWRGSMNRTLTFFWSYILLSILATHSFASRTTETRNQIHAIQHKVGHLESVLQKSISSRETLYQALANTEKSIHQQIQSLRNTQNDLQEKEKIITKISSDIQTLQEKQTHTQKNLAHLIQTNYQLNFNHPVKWLFESHQEKDVDRLLTYYKYLVTQEKHLLQTLQQDENQLRIQQNKKQQEISELKVLQTKLLKQQNDLKTTKQKNATILSSLNQTIHSKQALLQQYKKDQIALEKLLQTLLRAPQVTPVSNAKPTDFAKQPPIKSIQFNKRFNSPLSGQVHQAKPLNQGMLFIAKEGTPITPVLPGKIVFSDWLNGYGLLIIIDHGNGTMSLYAHNESVFKTKGAYVKPGDQIASVGHTGGIRENGLYFELRRSGKAVPPRQWLA